MKTGRSLKKDISLPNASKSEIEMVIFAVESGLMVILSFSNVNTPFFAMLSRPITTDFSMSSRLFLL